MQHGRPRKCFTLVLSYSINSIKDYTKVFKNVWTMSSILVKDEDRSESGSSGALEVVVGGDLGFPELILYKLGMGRIIHSAAMSSSRDKQLIKFQCESEGTHLTIPSLSMIYVMRPTERRPPIPLPTFNSLITFLSGSLRTGY